MQKKRVFQKLLSQQVEAAVWIGWLAAGEQIGCRREKAAIVFRFVCTAAPPVLRFRLNSQIFARFLGLQTERPLFRCLNVVMNELFNSRTILPDRLVLSMNLPEAFDPESENPQSVSLPLLAVVTVLSVLCWLLPRPEGMTPEAHRLAAVAVCIAGLWITQAIPMAATSLLPVALFPLLGIQSAKETARAFMEDSLFLYLGGMLIALAIERWGLHRRMALSIVRLVGVRPRRLVIGFALATFGLSMWISNTATTMLMLPIVTALLRVMDEGSDAGAGGPRPSEQLAIPLLLVLAWAATLGGMATPVGSPTNSVAIGIYHRQLPDMPPVRFSEWLLACGPIAVAYLAIVVWSLIWRLPAVGGADEQLKRELNGRMRQLGPITSAERRVLVIFVTTAVLWVFREPLEFGELKLFAGWQAWFAKAAAWLFEQQELGVELAKRGEISDATVAVLMAVLMFMIPCGTGDRLQRMAPLLNWQTAVRLPWDMILLFGGGFALASAFESTGLAVWLAGALEGPLSSQPAWVAVAVICLILVMLTELTSNVATVNAVLPALLALAVPLKLDPRMLFIPATLAASAGFMLPVGTPPNAIVFGTGRIPAREMARRGLLLNLVGVPLLTGGTWLLIRPILGIE